MRRDRRRPSIARKISLLCLGAFLAILPALSQSRTPARNLAKTAAAPLVLITPGVLGDFDGDGKADLLFRNTGNQDTAIWLMNGKTLVGSGNFGSPPADWVIKGVGDFDGDHKSDIIWQNSTTGQVIIWLLNGGTIASSGSPGSPGTNWSILGVGDFDGDGKADILWQDVNTGEVAIWLMNGTSIKGNGHPSAPISGYSVVGIGDYDGDGKADIAWQNYATGNVVIWLMNGTAINTSGSPGNVDPQWSVQGVGDFNHDGKADMLWRNATSGQVAIWFMNGSAIGGSTNPAAPSADWTIAGVGDYNGDGTADIAWHNSNGQVIIWLMSLGMILDSGSPGTPPIAWQLAQLAPYTCANEVLCNILTGSNNVRANGSFGPGNPAPSATAGGALTPFNWSVAATRVAQSWAATCPGANHNGNRGPFGENIYLTASTQVPVPVTGTDAVNSWDGEAVDYAYSTNTCAPGAMCGHFTQLVWRDTTAIGCAVQQCSVNSPFPGFPNYAMEVCDFAPPGNFPTQPY